MIDPISETKVTRDGVEYEIAVYHAGLGKFSATWRCTVCDAKSSALSADTTTNAALGRAKMNLLQHHAATHTSRST
jgi:hypothetical protein